MSCVRVWFHSPRKCFFFQISTTFKAWLEIAGVLFHYSFYSSDIVSLKICFLDSLLRVSRDPGGNGRIEPLHYIARLHHSCYSHKHRFSRLIILTVMCYYSSKRSQNCRILGYCSDCVEATRGEWMVKKIGVGFWFVPSEYFFYLG